MDMFDMIMHRRSVRQYTGKRIADDVLDKILYTGLAAASSKNRRPWEFVVVRDKTMLNKLGHCRPGAENLLGKCDTAIVVAADSEMVDVWVEDCASAMTQMHLMADSLGVGSCWLQVRLRTAPDGKRETQSIIRELLGIPEKYSVMAILTLGMPASHPGARTVADLQLSKIHREHF